MDIFSMLKALHEEKAAIEDAIRALNRLNTEERKARRGRPPKWLQGQRAAGTDPKGQPEAESSPPKGKPGRPKRRSDSSEQASAA